MGEFRYLVVCFFGARDTPAFGFHSVLLSCPRVLCPFGIGFGGGSEQVSDGLGVSTGRAGCPGGGDLQLVMN